MAQRLTITDLITEVRQQLDEVNNEAIGDEDDIIPALNRAQNYATDILARKYKEPLLTNTTVTSSGGLFSIPEDAFEDRLLKVEAIQGQQYIEVPFISYEEWDTVTDVATGIPLGYTITGRDVRLLPAGSSVTSFRIWYLQDPRPLAPSQGRINIVNLANNYVIVDSVGSGLSAESDNLASFVSLVDGATGVVKGTVQIQSINNNTITFKTVPTRSVVLDQTVDDDINALASGLVVAVDDYLALAPNTCIPFLKKPLANFLVQYAVAELTRKLGGDSGMEQGVLEKFEQQVERSWTRRPNNQRVKRVSPVWATYTRWTRR